MDFASFVLLNAVLFTRPMEFVPALYGTPLYNLSFCLCFFLSLPALLAPGTVRSALLHPMGLCLLTMGVTAVFSNLVRGRSGDAINAADTLWKVTLYYTLMIAVVRTPDRLRWFILWLVIDGGIVAGLGVVDYLGYASIPNLTITMETQYVDGEGVDFRRLGSTGFFGDPNDLGLFLVQCILCCFYLMVERDNFWLIRMGSVLPLLVLTKALLLTYSRAGMLSLLAGLAIYAIARYGRRALILAAMSLPLVMSIGGRQMDFSLSQGTGQSRVELWDAFFTLFVHNPILGIGYDHALDYSSLVAHNSYIHAYAELGFVGGSAFLGMTLLSVWTVLRLGLMRSGGTRFNMARVWPFLISLSMSQAIGLMSLSRCYTIPTFTIFGLAAVHEQIALAGSPRKPLEARLKLLGNLAVSSLAFLVFMYVLIKKNANY